MTGQLTWLKGGIFLGLVFFMTVLFVKPIGVSTQFVIFDGIVWNILSDDLIEKSAESKTGYASKNPYLNKSGGKYAKNISHPLNYSFIFVLSMVIGALLSAKTNGPNPESIDRVAPEIWRTQFGTQPAWRYLATFAGGVLVLYGSRLAGGCTSGHMMSGMMQTSISGYLFALAGFGAAVPTAILMFGHK